MKPTPCQEMATDAIKDWLLTPNEPFFMLTGRPGVGKSWVVDRICEGLLGQNSEMQQLAQILGTSSVTDFRKCATTNKAARNIGGETVHKSLGMRPKRNFQTGEMYYFLPNGFQRIRHQLIVVDETSMEDTSLMNTLNKAICHDTSKILRVGDKLQLAPVGLKSSPTFEQGWDGVDMETPVRQDADSALFETCTQLRTMVEQGREEELFFNDDVVQVGDDFMAEYFETMGHEQCLLGYTNDFALRLNQTIRQYKGVETDLFEEGERVVSNGVVIHGKKQILTNEQEVTISEVMEDITQNVQGVDCYAVATTAGLVYVPYEPSQYLQRLKTLKGAKKWREFYNLQESVADLRGTYTRTVNKSQGSTFDSVVINMNDLRKAKHVLGMDAYLRMLYVGISRAKHKAYVYGY